MPFRRFIVLTLSLSGACRGGSDAWRPPTEPALSTASLVSKSGAAPSGKLAESMVPAASEALVAELPTRAPSVPGELDAERADASAARSPVISALPATWPPIEPPVARSAWCSDGLTTLDERSCYILPAVPTRTLLVYLHGIVPPRNESPEKTKVQGVILKAAQRAGVVAVVPRGRAGFGPKGRRSWVGWPTTDPLYEKYAAELVGEFTAAQKKLEALTGVKFSPVYLAGSSSGAYFVASLAMHGGIDVDGFGAMSGGTGSETMELAGLSPKPFYIGYGKYDGYVRRAIPTLVDVLNRAHWPFRVAEHPTDHGAREIYLEEAFTFWREHAN